MSVEDMLHNVRKSSGPRLPPPSSTPSARRSSWSRRSANRLTRRRTSRSLAEANRAARVAAAQAQAEDVRLAGAAQANATQLNGAAQASAIRENGLAEAAGIEARAKALSTNQDAVIAQQYAENYPAIVAAAASSLGNIDNLVVLNGADGTEDLLAKAMTMGGAGLGLAQQLLSSIRNDKPVHPNTAKKANTILVPANGKVDHASA